MAKRKFYKGRKFGPFLVIEDLPTIGGHSTCLIRCFCGKEKEVFSHTLKKGEIKSCGCKKKTGFNNYGGRGIKVCEEWKDFMQFYRDMGIRPDNHSLERIDVNKGYSKNNCEWATKSKQCLNKRSTGKSGVLGVTINKGKFVSGIKKDGKRYHLGTFESLKEAEDAYLKKRKELHGF